MNVRFANSRIRRRVIHRFYGIANRNIFGGPRDATDGDAGESEDPEAQKEAASKCLIGMACNVAAK